MKSFMKRIRSLEARMIPKFVILRMADGSTHKIRGGVDLLHLFCEAAHDTGKENPVLKMIIDSVGSDENGRMIEAIKALAAGPIPRGMSYEAWEKARREDHK